MANAYPLTWPEGFPRCARPQSSKFKTTLSKALENVQTSIRLFGQDSGKPARNIVLSSNVTLGAAKPSDAGVAVYFEWDGMQVCIPVDRYSKVEDNLQAIHHVIEARRTELRHGGIQLVRAAFTGFVALPPPGTGEHWSDILSVSRTAKPEEIERAFRAAAKKHHPDHGGDAAMMTKVSRARDEALRDRMAN